MILSLTSVERAVTLRTIKAKIKAGCSDLCRPDISILHALHELVLGDGPVKLELDDEEQVLLFSVLEDASLEPEQAAICGYLVAVMSRLSSDGKWDDTTGGTITAQGSVKSFRDQALAMNRQEFCQVVLRDYFDQAKSALAESYGCMTRDLKDVSPGIVQTPEALTLHMTLEGIPVSIALGNYSHLAYVAGETWDFHHSNQAEKAAIKY